jgi:hypothetical protein
MTARSDRPESEAGSDLSFTARAATPRHARTALPPILTSTAQPSEATR